MDGESSYSRLVDELEMTWLAPGVCVNTLDLVRKLTSIHRIMPPIGC